MEVENTKTIKLSPKDVEQAIAEWLSPYHSGVMQGATEYKFNIRGGSLDTAYDSGSIFDGCTVTITEKEGKP